MNNFILINNQKVGLELAKERFKTLDVADWRRLVYGFLVEWFDVEKTTVWLKTSGSTGLPKTFEVKKTMLTESAKLTGLFFDLKPNDVALMCLSADYVAGKMMLVRAAVLGLDLICIEPDSTVFKHFSPTRRIDFAAFLPIQLYQILKDKNHISWINHYFKTIIVGGASIDAHQETLALHQIKASIFATFGMTETVSHIALRPLGSESYTLLPHTSMDTDGRSCLKIRSVVTQNEWIATNDLVELVSEHEFIWLGRLDNVVNSGGVKVVVEVLEREILALIELYYEALMGKRFFIFGLKDDFWGEKICLVFELNSTDFEPLESDFKLILRQHLVNKYWMPKQFFAIKTFVETQTQKIDRQKTIALLLSNN